MTTHGLVLDSCGDLWLTVDTDATSSARLLGPAGDPATADRVPAELAGRLAELEAEWADAVEYRAECRAEVERTWLRAKGAR